MENAKLWSTLRWLLTVFLDFTSGKSYQILEAIFVKRPKSSHKASNLYPPTKRMDLQFYRQTNWNYY